ncbi:helix-turn-helix domain-containing protein [Streptomyces sp. NPDC102340]|uniref:helix-turn-helix domain-containing protein n=1 Tax=unclassified Streptomyces TaxID=2593676 RepID=UPI0038064C6E
MIQRFTYPEAAAELRVSESWLRKNIKSLPHSKKGRVVTFTAEDLKRIDELCHHEPTTGPLAIVAAPKADGPHPLAALRPLPPRGAAVRTS